MAPIVTELSKRKQDFELLHVTQHYDRNLSNTFFEQLNLPEPSKVSIPSAQTGTRQIGNIILAISDFLPKDSLVLVEGDTNTVLGSAVAAVHNKATLCHVEAGLRNYDWRQPEEYNRRMVDHISHHLFAPTEFNVETLKSECVQGTIYQTGNTVVDSVLCHKARWDKVKIDTPKKFILATVHRQEYVDCRAILSNVAYCLSKAPVPVIIPLHPRTARRMEEFGLHFEENVTVMQPADYFTFLKLLDSCSLVVTDSGGVVEEATVLHKPIVILRDVTDRQEAVDKGFAIVSGTQDTRNILNSIISMLFARVPNSQVFGDGKAAERIVNLLEGLA